MDKFDIIEYLAGLTGYVFDKAVLKRIALDRGVLEVVSYEELDAKTKDLLLADLLYVVYLSPNVWASSQQSHAGFTQSIGSQTTYVEDKKRLYNTFLRIYKKYDDAKLNEVSSGTIQWIDCF